jgi:hypothetical protein
MSERMTDRVKAGPLHGTCPGFKEAVCIDTSKVYDSCSDKDCLENLKVYLTTCGQDLVDRAINVKCRKSEIIWVYSDLEPVPFNEGFFTIDIKYFFKITLDVFLGVATPQRVEGLATFDKKVILFGSEGKARKFSSKYKFDGVDRQSIVKNNLPKAIVEVVEPICLSARLVDAEHHHHHCNELMDISSVPNEISDFFDEPLVTDGERKVVLVSLGIFSIIKIERDVQLLIPAFDFCIPDKQCIGSTEQDPCELFERINFPLDEFFPPQAADFA